MKRWSTLVAVAVLFVAVGSSRAFAAPQGTQAEEPMWWFGFQFHASTDGRSTISASDTPKAIYDSSDSTHYDAGVGFTLPLSVNLFRGLGFRLALSTTYSGSPPFNDATAQLSYIPIVTQGAGADREYVTRGAFFLSNALLWDVQYTFSLLRGTIKPYLGAGPGVYLNFVFTDLTVEDYYDLLNNQYNDTDNSDNIDPYSVNVRPGFNGYVGLNFLVSGSTHLNFQVQYDLAQMPEAPLLKASDGSDARRAAYTYSALALSAGLLYNF